MLSVICISETSVWKMTLGAADFIPREGERQDSFFFFFCNISVPVALTPFTFIFHIHILYTLRTEVDIMQPTAFFLFSLLYTSTSYYMRMAVQERRTTDFGPNRAWHRE